MDRRKELQEAMARMGMTVPQYAERCGVSQSVIYKFLQGLDVRLSTWDRIDPGTYRQEYTLPDRSETARTIP